VRSTLEDVRSMEGLGRATRSLAGVLRHSLVNLTPKMTIGNIRIEAFREEHRISESADRFRWRAFEARPLFGHETETQLNAKTFEQLIDLSILHGRQLCITRV